MGEEPRWDPSAPLPSTVVTPTPNGGMEPREYLRVLRRRKWTIAAGMIVVVSAALLFSFLQTPVYEASTRVLLRPRASVFETPSQQLTNPALVQTEIQLLRSDQVRSLVRDRLGYDATKVAAVSVEYTAVVEYIAKNS